MDLTTKRVLQAISFFGLVLSIVPALLYFRGSVSQSAYYNLLVVGMVLWFGAAVFWIKPAQNN
jgi:hypothetical protein